MIIVESRYKTWLGILAAIFLGMTFAVASGGKLFAQIADLELLILSPEYIPVYSIYVLLAWLALIELIVGILLVVGIFVKPIAGFSLLLIAGFITSNILIKMSGQEECLSCFGAMGKLSVSQALQLDGIMVALAVTVLVFYPGRFFNVRPWYWGK